MSFKNRVCELIELLLLLFFFPFGTLPAQIFVFVSVYFFLNVSFLYTYQCNEKSYQTACLRFVVCYAWLVLRMGLEYLKKRRGGAG